MYVHFLPLDYPGTGKQKFEKAVFSLSMEKAGHFGVRTAIPPGETSIQNVEKTWRY